MIKFFIDLITIWKLKMKYFRVYTIYLSTSCMTILLKIDEHSNRKIIIIIYQQA